MGWRLAEEVACSRPELAGPEWWTLLDLAQNANDDTRRAMPGAEHLMARAKVSRATIQRRLKKLTDAGLIKLVEHSAPGKRAVYEIPIIVIEPEHVSPYVRRVHVSPYVRRDQEDTSQKSLNMSHPYGDSPLVTTPVINTNGSAVTPTVEGKPTGRHVKPKKSIRRRVRDWRTR